jgi:acylphosphatase
VAYRYSARREAVRLKLTGWVRNRADGSVEALFEGEPEWVDQMITWCRQGPPGAYVTQVDVTRSEATGAFTRFDITY